MKKRPESQLLVTLLGCLVLPILVVRADEPLSDKNAWKYAPASLDDVEENSVESLPREFRDASFERYLDLRLVRDAFDARDAGLLTDVALQMAEGERVLQRSHKSGLTSKRLLSRAVRLAADTRNQAALSRLTRVAQAAKQDDLVAQITTAERLIGASRAVDSAFTISLEAADIETLTDIKGWLDTVQDATLLGDKEALKSIRKEIGHAQLLSDKDKEAFFRQIDAVSETTSESESQDSLLLKLAAASRNPESYRQHIINATNEYRTSNGRNRLSVGRMLCQIAIQHANNMARQDKYGDTDNNGHVLDGQGAADRIRAAGYDGAWAENVGYKLGYANPPQKQVESWINSTGHRENMLTSHFTQIGVGAAKGNSGRWYFVQVFGRPRSQNVTVTVQISNRTDRRIGFRIGSASYSLGIGQRGTYSNESTTGRVQYVINWPEVSSGGIGVGGAEVGFLTNRRVYTLVGNNGNYRFSATGAMN